MPLKQPAAGDVIGAWKLKRRLGRGGNGEVWLATNASDAAVAIKLLTKPKLVAYKRFRDEIRTMRDNKDVPGVMPVIDAYLPEDFEAERSWYAMPVATPLLDTVGRFSLIDKVRAIVDIADTIASLHERGIVHRDIKPANLLHHGGRYAVGDFGLVDFPEKDDLTGAREEIGPRWTMAPEVRRHDVDADGRSADVYSLAKTLWILATGKPLAFDGQYSRSTGIALSSIERTLFLTPLDALLTDCTEHEPSGRPTMLRVAERLRQWLAVISDFPERNRLEWAEVQRALFPVVTPQRSTWENLDDIVQVLTILGERSNLNHLFFPEGGGLDLHGARRSQRELGCIEIDTQGIVSVLKPKSLFFEAFLDEPHWNYFRLEAEALDASRTYADLGGATHEQVTDIGGARYAPYSCWEANEFEGAPLPTGSRPLSRYLRGAFVIFQKTSPYNLNTRTYDGRHNKMNTDEFRKHIADVIAHLASRQALGSRKE